MRKFVRKSPRKATIVVMRFFSVVASGSNGNKTLAGSRGFHLKKFTIIQIIFELARSKNLVVNNKDNRVFMCGNY